MEHLRTCLNGYGVPFFPSKADRIMSRYRLIAPKPALPSFSDVERSASSVVTFDNLCIRQVPDAPPSVASKQKSKRARKRPNRETEGHQPSAKRPALETAQVSQKPQPLQGSRFGSPVQEATSLLIQEDAGFMARAAASAPPSVFPQEKRKAAHNYSYGGCFTELIRGISGLPTANHVHNLLQQQQQQQHLLPNFVDAAQCQPQVDQLPKQQQDEGNPQEREGIDFSKDDVCSGAFWSCFSDVDVTRDRAMSEEAQQSDLDEEGNDGECNQRRGIVTLNLLPESPTAADSPTLSTSSCNSSRPSVPGMSSTCMEQVYGHSSEPVILTDDTNHKVLWANQAYLKAAKGSSSMLAPFIDPLGAPTRLGIVQFQPESQGECSSATLWGFLKKFVVDISNRSSPRWLPLPGNASLLNATESSVASHAPPQQHCLGTPQQRSQGMSNQANAHTLKSSGVITPQPMRLVGSTVSVESIAEIQNGDAITGTVELVKQQLEESNLPGFITDAWNVVRWVNTAYKVMVRQPECRWLASAMKDIGEASPTIAGEVLLTCNVEIPVLSAVFFSGRANVQWTRNMGERSCITLPCDVSVIVDNQSKRMLAWRFDIQASLSLSCRAERLA